MSQHFPATAKALRVALLCAALVPLAAACNAKSSASAAGATGTAHAASSAAATAQAATASAAANAASGVSATCPSAAAVTAAAGSTYPKPQVETADGETSCIYSDPSTGANLNIGISSSHGITSTVLQSTLASQAGSTGGATKPISGIGTAAYLLTENDASTNSDGVATNIVGAITSTEFVIVVGEMSPAGAEAVTRLVIG
jgi:hypothetical protein